MPDAAVDAARLGLAYTEPRGNAPPAHMKGMKVRFERDPTNPYAPPKRVIEKMGFWERVLGPWPDKGDNQPPVPAHSVLPSTAPRPLPSTTGPAQTAAAAETHPSSVLLRPTPFPAKYAQLPRAERKAWDKQRKEEMRYIDAVAKEHRAAVKAEHAAEEREAREVQKREATELKARKNAIKLEKKLGYRPMPEYIPPARTSRPLPTVIAAPPAAAAGPAGPGQPTSWMLLPTLEEFGVRRPFDAPGRPDGLGGRKVDIAGTEWPMMSRTMTYAIQDMSREERVRMDQAGHTWSPAWYRD